MRIQSTFLVLLISMMILTACGGGDGTSPTAPTYPSGKPTGVTAEPANQSAQISWNSVAGAVGYYVYISQNGISFSRYDVGIIESTAFSVHNLTNGLTYYFGVSAVGAGGWESSIAYPGGTPTAVPVVPGDYTDPGNPLDGVPPDPPENLQGFAKDAACEIEWDPCMTGDFAYYNIYRRSSGNAYVRIISNYNLLSYRDDDLVNDQLYSYYVTAVDDEGLESDPSNAVSLEPMDLIPEILKNGDIYVNPGRIFMEWDMPLEADIVAFAIERVEPDPIIPDSDTVIRFLVPKPTATFDAPDTYADGLITVWQNPDLGQMYVQDMAIVSQKIYTYRISVIDAAGQEGPPLELVTPVPTF